MTNTDPIFWHFDIEDIGTKDLPAMIDYIRDVTKWSKVTYFGHDQGNQEFFMGASLNPSFFNNRVDFLFAVQPKADQSS
jgi:pimeloyl-ACP methyl ester carboxylesterase